MLCGPVAGISTGREQTRVPTSSARVVPGPCSTISAQNSWPMMTSRAEVHDARVAGPARGLDELIGELQRVQVGAADPAGQRADEHLARARLGRRDVGDHELAVAHDGGAHRLHHLRSWASSSMSALRPR